MSTEYRNNHYVPQWYQKRFIPDSQVDKSLYYRDLKPRFVTDKSGKSYQLPSVRRWGTKSCFSEDDLYTTWFGEQRDTKIEAEFFGQIDSRGREAVSYFCDFSHPSINPKAFNDMVMYMSTQKLRTPKGLDWLASKMKTHDRNGLLRGMLRLRQLYCAIWTESVWQIADASASSTKFIISDHPVAVYNRFLGPRHSTWCSGPNDPDIALNGTHTIFPLSPDKVLILTNLSWVRNPYRAAIKFRPNPNPMRGAIFNFHQIQTNRTLSEQEVREINFIIKSRASRYIASAKEEWLYPEEHVSKSQWNSFGDGYLLMPDPRALHYGGEIIIGYEDGTSIAFDEFGRRPWEAGYSQPTDSPKMDTLHRFQGEFARMLGPNRRGLSFNMVQLDDEIDNEGMHAYFLKGH